MSKADVDVLNAWAELGVKNKWLDKGCTDQGATDKRLTSRPYTYRYKFPKEILDISHKVRAFVGVSAYPLTEQGQNGIVVSYTLPGGDVFKHKDAKSNSGLATLRCNVLTQKADAGCQLYVDGVPINFKVGDLHCYLVSEHEHWVTKATGNTPRIMWMFGAHVPAEDWNCGKIKVQR
jgi:hypothetical protein